MKGSGDACLIVSPVPNSSIEQWRMVVIVIGYTLFLTSQYDDIFMFPSFAKYVVKMC